MVIIREIVPGAAARDGAELSLHLREAFFMLGRIARFVFGVAGWFLLIVGALVVGLVVWFVAGEGRARPVAEPAPAKVEAVETCDCAAGAVCVGRRGGRYCLRKDGSKKYVQAAE